MPNFRLLGSIIKKKYPKVADPLNAVEYKNGLLTAFNCIYNIWEKGN